VGKEIAENLHNFRSGSRAQMKRIQITRDPMPYGSVLIVDDVETNIFVANGLLSPYSLRLDSTESGFGAIERIKNGREYDIIFMDHMMPKMDGVETTKILRSMGYKLPIVALTANAVAGQADIFLGNGFDDYISKPIDIRQLNSVLNKLVRDKHPPEVVEEARRRAMTPKTDSAQTALNAMFVDIFIRDVNKTLAVLEQFVKREGPHSEDEVRTYIIHAHGVKSALANMGRLDLSATALRLEMLGRDNDIDALLTDTPGFINSLRDYINKLRPQDEAPAAEAADDDTGFLREKLMVVKSSCEQYDEYDAGEAMAELSSKTWSPQTKEMLETIAAKLLHSDFDDIVAIIEAYCP